MRIVFAGTPAIAVPSLLALHSHHQIVAVLTSPDSATGRNRQENQSAVKLAANDLGLLCLQPVKLDQSIRTQLSALQPDILVCFAYGFIFGPKFMSVFPCGGINLHPSLLPRYRGPSPLSAAILAGDHETGLTVQRLAQVMDAGEILIQVRFPLAGSETTASLSSLAASQGADLVLLALEGLEKGTIIGQAQDESEVSFCHLITREDGRINWNLSAVKIERMVRAYDPWPHAFTSWQNELLSILEAKALPAVAPSMPVGTVLRVDKPTGILVQTGEGLLALRRLQLQSKKALDFQSFLNGARGFVGSALGA